ncbi:MAG: MarR family transcriptional regulator [Pseudolabrys sp.]|nr:MarR family transcriptional regulator [Pseudolabrys sp.]
MTVVVNARTAAASSSASRQRLRLWLRLLRATRAIEAELRERLRVQFSITLPQFDVMAALSRRQAGITMTELSRMLIVSNGNVTGIIDRLVAEKLVARQPSPDDRRSVLVRLTAKGHSLFATVARAHQGWIDQLLADFDAAEAEVLIAHLDGLPDRIRNGGARP